MLEMHLWPSFPIVVLLALLAQAKDQEISPWTAQVPPRETIWDSVAFGNNLFVVVPTSGTGLMTSPDGIQWTAQTAPAQLAWDIYGSVTFGNNLFVATTQSGIGAAGMITSPDGIQWTYQTGVPEGSWQAVIFGNNVFVAVGNGVITSPDGIHWTAQTAPAAVSWLCVTFGNNLFVAVGSSAAGTPPVITSPEGIHWTAQNAVTQRWMGVTFGNNLFVAVAGGGVAGQIATGPLVMTSPDGMHWTAQTPAVRSSWCSVAFGNNLFVAVASSGPTMTSPDGIHWTAQTTASDYAWSILGFGNNRFVVVGSGVMTKDACRGFSAPGQPCHPGAYQPSEICGETCRVCPPGGYCPSAEMAQPTNCSAGTFQPHPGATSCLECPAGSYCPEGAEAPTTCEGYPRARYCPPLSAQANTCDAGYYCSNSSQAQAPCPAGSYCPQGSYTPKPCVVSEYCPPKSSQAELCPAGSFCPTPLQQVNCLTTEVCQLGSVSAAPCPAGHYCPAGNEAHPCPTGSYCPANSAEPLPCPTGSYCISPTAATATRCPAGTVNAHPNQTLQRACLTCYAGTYAKDKGSSHCQDCPAGTYMPSAGSAVCTKCPAGRWSSLTGAADATTCLGCPVMYYSSQEGATKNITCKPCQPGFVALAVGSAICTEQPCAAGTYWSAEGCLNCPPGKYKSLAGDDEQCTVCPSDTYGPKSEATDPEDCLACPLGQLSRSGSSQASDCSECPAGTTPQNVEGSGGRCHACPQGTYKDVLGLGPCKACLAKELCTVAAQIPLPYDVGNHKLLTATAQDAAHLEILTGGVNVSVSSQLPNTHLLHDINADVSDLQDVCGLVAASVVAALVIAFAVIYSMSERFKNSVSCWQQLFNLNHHLDYGESPTKRQTPLGALFTVVSFVLVLAVVAIMAQEWYYVNFLVESSYTTFNPSSDLAQTDFSVEVIAFGVAPTMCNEHMIAVEIDQAQSGRLWSVTENTVVRHLPRTVSTISSGCKVVVALPHVAYRTESSDGSHVAIIVSFSSFVTGLQYKLTATAPLPNQVSSSTVEFWPWDGTHVLVQTVSSSIAWQLATYSCTTNSTTTRGYQIIATTDQQQGNSSAAPVPMQDFVTLRLNMELLSGTQNLDVTRFRTWLSWMSKMGGSVVALLGGLAFIFSQSDKLSNYSDRCTRNSKANDPDSEDENNVPGDISVTKATTAPEPEVALRSMVFHNSSKLRHKDPRNIQVVRNPIEDSDETIVKQTIFL